MVVLVAVHDNVGGETIACALHNNARHAVFVRFLGFVELRDGVLADVVDPLRHFLLAVLLVLQITLHYLGDALGNGVIVHHHLGVIAHVLHAIHVILL